MTEVEVRTWLILTDLRFVYNSHAGLKKGEFGDGVALHNRLESGDVIP